MMATFFGEVLSVYSRAVDDDDGDDVVGTEDDEEILRELEEKRAVQLEWNQDISESLKRGSKLQCSDLIIAVGHNAVRIMSAHVLHSAKWDAVGHISAWNERSQTVSMLNDDDSASVIYRHTDNPHILICQVTRYISEDQLFQWAEKVLGSIEHRGLNVTLLSDFSVAEYKASEYMYCSSAPFLRSLHTTTLPGQSLCPALEQPNIVTGLAAAVLSYCQVHCIPANTYQCYSDIIGPNPVTMDAYKPILSALTKSRQLVMSPDLDAVAKPGSVTEFQSNMYI